MQHSQLSVHAAWLHWCATSPHPLLNGLFGSFDRENKFSLNQVKINILFSYLHANRKPSSMFHVHIKHIRAACVHVCSLSRNNIVEKSCEWLFGSSAVCLRASCIIMQDICVKFRLSFGVFPKILPGQPGAGRGTNWCIKNNSPEMEIKCQRLQISCGRLTRVQLFIDTLIRWMKIL